MISLWGLIVLASLGQTIAPSSAHVAAGEIVFSRGGALYSATLKQPSPGRNVLSNRKRLCAVAVTPWTITVSRDGRFVAFSPMESDQIENTGEPEGVYVLDRRKPGGRAELVAHGWMPAFRGASHEIAYTRLAEKGKLDYGFRVAVYDLDKRAGRDLVSHARDPSWSADGTRLAYVDASTQSFQPPVVVVTYSAMKELYRSEEWNVEPPILSPDGRYVAYNPSMSRPQLAGVVARVDTGDRWELLTGSPVLAWAPSGHRLLWTYSRSATYDTGVRVGHRPYVSSVSSKGPSNKALLKPRRGAAFMCGAFTAGGRSVVFTRSRGGERFDVCDLYVQSLSGGTPRLLVRGVAPGLAVRR